MTAFYRKAKQGVADAELLFQAGGYDACANRAYYAAFHAAIALLARYGIENPKNPHEWVQAQFSAEIAHRRKIFPRAYVSILMDLQSARNIADYEERSVARASAERQLRKTKTFVAEIIKLLEKTP